MLLLLLYFILGTSNASQDVINTGGKTIHVFSGRGRNVRLNRLNSFIVVDPDNKIPGSWPWAVSIGYQDGRNWVHACDGVIVTNGSVVTSAACLANCEWNEKTVETLSVRAGDNHLKFHKEKIQLANVSRHEKHPGFNASVWPMEHYEDVAVLFLLPSLNFTRSVKPIYIPTLEEGMTTTKAKDTDITLTTCGWGGKLRDGGRKLQDAVITSLEDNFCHFVYRGDGLSKNLTDEILCAANVIDLSGTCKVGQGSGIFRLYHDPFNHTKNRYVLTGILSSHIESDGNITCGSPHTPNVFVRVASRSILSFLYKTIYNIESDSSAADAPAQPSIELDQEPTLDPYYESCGVNNIIDHILDMELNGTNGQQEKATWPWLVPLLVNRTTPMNFEFICAGTILTEDKILTAAHCFDDIYDEMMIKVRAGDVFLNNAIDDSMVQEVYIFKSDVTIHPNYTENRYFDLAILHLRSKFNFTTKVRPVCLISPQEAATITKNNETLLSILVSGWGRDSLGRYGQDLWQIVAEIFSKAICDNTYSDSSHIRNLLPNLFTEEVLCAGDPAGDSGTCHGDSGGGAVHFDQKRRRYVARAVVSGSKHGQCGSGFAPNIYARLADVIVNNWIFSQINFTAPTDMVFEDGNNTFVSGSTVTYNCSTTSNPVSQISWKLTDHLNNTLLFQESSSEERFGQNWMKTSRITFVFPRDSDSVEVKCTGKNVMGHLSATAVLSAECPEEKGFCVLPNGGDQNSGVIKLDVVDGNTSEQKEKCLSKCSSYPGATGCEVIWNQGNRGCYVHTQEVDRGNGVNNHACWIFSKCPGSKLQFQLKGEAGQQKVKISIDGKVEECGLTTEWQTFSYPRPSVGVFSVEFHIDNGPNHVYIQGHESQVQDLLPDFKYNRGWGCGTKNENPRCVRLRNGDLLWNGNYTYILKDFLVADPSDCEEGWTQAGDSCFFLSRTKVSTLPGARETCRSMDARLAQISSQEENDAVVAMAEDAMTENLDGLDYWIDGKEAEDGWQFEGGESMHYFNWWGDSPDGEAMGSLKGGCIQLLKHGNTKPQTLDSFYWARAGTGSNPGCTSSDGDNGYICQKQAM